MTTPKLYADREATMTDEEIARLRAIAACMPPRQFDVWARDMLRLCDALTEARRERDEAEARGRSQGRVDVAKYSRAIGEIEAALGYSGARPLSETVAAVRQLKTDCDEARAMLAEAEAALLESQNERDALADRLEAYEPSPKPRKFA